MLWSWDDVLALIPVLANASGRGANLCVSCLYSQACLHTQFHLGLFWPPVKTQASGTNSVYEKKDPCMFNYNRTLSLSLLLVLSIDLSSERSLLQATVNYCHLFKVWQEENALIFKVLATILSRMHTHLHVYAQVSSASSSPDLGFLIQCLNCCNLWLKCVIIQMAKWILYHDADKYYYLYTLVLKIVAIIKR